MSKFWNYFFLIHLGIYDCLRRSFLRQIELMEVISLLEKLNANAVCQDNVQELVYFGF